MSGLRVQSLWIYPVKSCAGVQVQAAQVSQRGFRGDRRWMIVDEAGRHLTQREIGAMALLRPQLVQGGIRFEGGPQTSANETTTEIQVTIWRDTVAARLAPGPVNAWLSDQLGASVRLVHMPETTVRGVNPDFSEPGDAVSFADGYPYLLANVASLEDLNTRLPSPIPMRRFRPNIVVSGAGAWEEDGWKRVVVGEIPFDVTKPCERCVIVDTDPDTGVREKGVLSALSTFRRVDGKVLFAQNAIARGSGSVSVGDSVDVLD